MKLWKHSTWTAAFCVLGAALLSTAHAQDDQVKHMKMALAHSVLGQLRP